MTAFDPSTLLNPVIKSLSAYKPVEPLDSLSAELGFRVEDLVKLDANENPYGPPRSVALIANERNMAVYEKVRQQREAQQVRETRDAESLAEALKEVSCNVAVRAGEEDRIFGSVTAQQIADALSDLGFDIDRRDIELEEPIRALGVYDVPIRLYAGIVVSVKVWVVRE